MKTYTYLMMLMLMMASAFAELEHFSTEVNVTISGTTCRIDTEDNQIRTYTANTNVNDKITINLYRNTSCREDDLYNYLESITKIQNDSLKYQTLYNNCTLTNTFLEDKAYAADNKTYKEKYDSCSVQLSQAGNNANNANQNTELINCRNQLATASGSKNNTMIISAIVGFAIAWFMFNKSFARGPTERLPPTR